MSGFTTDLEVRLVDDTANSGRGEWELISDLVYESDVFKGTFVVQAGFRTDFESVPRIPGVFDFLGDRIHRAAALHDAFYSGQFPWINRETADKLLKEAAISTGMSATDAELVYLGVREFGESHWEKVR